jgi:hypothetical protein
MKTTVEISDALLDRAREQARRSGRPVRALIEEGLRLVLEAERSKPAYRLPDRSVGRHASEGGRPRAGTCRGSDRVGHSLAVRLRVLQRRRQSEDLEHVGKYS